VQKVLQYLFVGAQFIASQKVVNAAELARLKEKNKQEGKASSAATI